MQLCSAVSLFLCMSECVYVHAHECFSVFHPGISSKKILRANTCSPGKESFYFFFPFFSSIEKFTLILNEILNMLFYIAIFIVTIWYSLHYLTVCTKSSSHCYLSLLIY